MKIGIRPGFLKLVQRAGIALAAVAALAALADTWSLWSIDDIARMIAFSLCSLFRSALNGLIVFAAPVVLIWAIWLAMARLVVTGLKEPKFPWGIFTVTLMATAATAVTMLVVDWSFNLKAAKLLKPIEAEFIAKSGCDGIDCTAPQEILDRRDKLIAEIGASRIDGWYVRNPLGTGTVHSTKHLMCFWKPGFFPVFDDW